MAIHTLVIVSCDCCNAVGGSSQCVVATPTDRLKPIKTGQHLIFPGETILSRFPQITAWEQAVSIGWRSDDNGDVLCPDCFQKKQGESE